MHLTRRTASALLFATFVGVSALGASPAGARPGDFVPNPPTPPRPLTFSIHDAEVVEGDPGDGNVLSFEITGSRANGSDVTMRAHTGNLGFEATPGADFTEFDEDVTMPAGQTSLTVEVPVTGDLEVETDELVIIWLSDPSSGSIELSGDTALGRILDDDTPTIHISQVAQAEGSGGGFTSFVFTVSLSHATTQDVSVDLTPSGGVGPEFAEYGTDFIAPANTVVIPAGETSEIYVVSVVADDVQEGDEDFVVEMSNPVGGTIVGGGGLGTILNDDGPAIPVGPGNFQAKQKATMALAIRLALILNG